jgi:hypothetical protein
MDSLLTYEPCIDDIYIYKFWYDVYNQYESFIYLDIMIKSRKIPIEMYFK